MAERPGSGGLGGKLVCVWEIYRTNQVAHTVYIYMYFHSNDIISNYIRVPGIYFQEQRCLENTGVLPGIGRGYSIYVGSNHAHPRTAHELAHLSRIAQDFKICVDELRPIAQPGKTCIAHHVAPIAHSGPNELARVAPIAHAGKYGQMSYSP